MRFGAYIESHWYLKRGANKAPFDLAEYIVTGFRLLIQHALDENLATR